MLALLALRQARERLGADALHPHRTAERRQERQRQDGQEQADPPVDGLTPALAHRRGLSST